ncbi:hypothetical protein [uncultured Streptococcus sp.]|uniref:hypothetical protein n=1 Tax=uncultured Streptococcus sp. TaxID=83427 RepID=UPI0027DB7A48|nr:hypothetical protein [uncultured Streptococcus sp.]
MRRLLKHIHRRRDRLLMIYMTLEPYSAVYLLSLLFLTAVAELLGPQYVIAIWVIGLTILVVNLVIYYILLQLKLHDKDD